MRRFKAPSVTNPPALVVVEWIDAQSDDEYEGSADEAGALILLPNAGYHVRNGRSPEGVPFVVLAREYSISTGVQTRGQVMVRGIISVPTGWIKKWSVAEHLTQIYPTPSGTGKEVSPQ